MDKLGDDVRATSNLTDFEDERWAAFGLDANPATAEDFAAAARDEFEKWVKTNRTACIQPD